MLCCASMHWSKVNNRPRLRYKKKLVKDIIMDTSAQTSHALGLSQLASLGHHCADLSRTPPKNA